MTPAQLKGDARRQASSGTSADITADFGEGCVPDQCFVLCDEEIGLDYAIEVDELRVRIAQFAVQGRGEGAE